MAENAFVTSQNGQEVQAVDLGSTFSSAAGAGIGLVAGLADDRVFAEFLRLHPYDGSTVAKAIFPWRLQSLDYGTSLIAGTVGPTNSANGSVQIAPFRAIIGSRNVVGTVPSPNYQNATAALANWRDIRSGIFMGSSTTFTQAQALSANASGNPRWDLVYATVAVDANGPSVTRRVKDPSSGNLTAPTIPAYLTQTVTISVVTGTPAGSPTFPAIPADSAGNYNIPLAYVRVPNGFGAASTVVTTDIVDVSPCMGISSSSGVQFCRPAGSNSANPIAGGGIYTNFPWLTTSPARPPMFMPPSLIGGDQLLVQVDATATPSHSNGAIVDSTRDWRNRLFMTFTQAGLITFATAPSGGTVRIPGATTAALAAYSYFGQSMVDDHTNFTGLPSGASAVSYAAPAQLSTMAASSSMGVYVNQSDGTMRWYMSGTSPNVKVFVWIFASAPFANY